MSALPETTKKFLEVAGLPVEAAPFLSFAPETLHWLAQAGADLDQLYWLGSDGSGNPLVADEDGVVWLIDHETTGRRTLVNSSVPTLAECVLAYRNFVAETIAVGGDDAYLDGEIPKGAIEKLSSSIQAIDNAGAQSGSFWGEELLRLSAEAGI